MYIPFGQDIEEQGGEKNIMVSDFEDHPRDVQVTLYLV